MISALEKQPDGTIKLTITIPTDDVKKTWAQVIENAVKTAEVAGFRKGKAPRNLVEEKIDIEKVREEVLKKLLPKFYTDAIQEHNLKPIINPKIHVEKLEDPPPAGGFGKDWQFTALTCETPVVNLNNYKDNIKKITAAATFDVAKSKIVIPGKPFGETQGKEQEVKFEDIVKALLESVTSEIPGILVDNETDRLLSQTLEDVKKLGLTLDQYLTSTGKTPEALREEYRKKAQNDIALEFALAKISEEEHIAVESKEIDEAIQKTKDPKERENLENNKYVLANILRQQKTLDFLKNL